MWPVLRVLEAGIVKVDVSQDESIPLNLEREANLLIQAGFEDLAASEALDSLGLQARMSVILGEELERLGELGAGFLGQARGCLGEPGGVDEVHRAFRGAALRTATLSMSAAISSVSPGP